MADVQSCVKILERYSIARIPFISVNTSERSRVLEIVKQVADNIRLPFYVHTLSKGMYDLSTGRTVNEDRSVSGALDFISQQVRQRQNLSFILAEVSDIENDSLTARQFLDVVMLAEECGAIIIVITTNPVWSSLQRLGMSVALDMPSEEEMFQIIKEAIEPYQRDISIEWDINDYKEAATILTGISRIEAQNVIASLIANRTIKKADMVELRYAKDRMFSNISGLERFDITGEELNIGGLSGLKLWLSEKRRLLSAEKREKLRERKIPPPRGILLVGVPGCGKSLSAKAIAASWQMPLYRLDFATVQGMYVGQSEGRLKEALCTAEHISPCVLWIDEIEKGLAGAQGSGDSGVSVRMVGQFLFWLQECRKPVFVVATSNDVSKLPPELLRRGRFDELFFVDLPTNEERKEIIGLYIKRFLRTEISNNLMEELVDYSEGFAGADLESAVKEVGYNLIANENLQISDDLLKSSFQNVVPLSKVNPEKIEEIRNWGRERAIPASGQPIGGTSVPHKSRRIVLV
jgi:SpoVK/Ycf46/Vps4 family AAA+-type ATPase